MNINWTLQEAVALCHHIETLAPANGCHVALTGGLLYKLGERKDCDLVFYRIREREEIDRKNLFADLNKHLGISVEKDCGWCTKLTFGGKAIDALFPESDSTSKEIAKSMGY